MAQSDALATFQTSSVLCILSGALRGSVGTRQIYRGSFRADR